MDEEVSGKEEVATSVEHVEGGCHDQADEFGGVQVLAARAIQARL